MKPTAGFADGLGLTITAFEPAAAQPAASNGMPLAWRVHPASKPAVARVAAELRSGASPVSGQVNGNLAIVSADDLAGTWATDVGQADGDARFTFDADGKAELLFSPPAGRRFFRAVLSREGRESGTAPLRDWNAAETSLWVTCTVDAVPTNGLHCSLAFSAEGVLGIAYYDSLEQDLKYASYDGATLKMERVDTAGDVGQYCSLAFGPGGYPAISYQRYDATFKAELRYAVKNAAGWTLTTVQQLNGDLKDTSLAFASNGYPAIVYYDYGNDRIRYARWDGSAWLTEDTYTRYAVSLSLAFAPGGQAAVAYQQWMNAALVYMTRGQYGWSVQTVEALPSVYNAHASLAFAPDGQPAIGYHDDKRGYLKYARYDGAQWAVSTIDADGFVGAYSSLTFSPDGRPAISYYDATRGVLKLAEWIEGVRMP